MKQPHYLIGTSQWRKASPGRYGIYTCPTLSTCNSWHLVRGPEQIGKHDTLAEAVDAAHAHAEAEALKVPTC